MRTALECGDLDRGSAGLLITMRATDTPILKGELLKRRGRERLGVGTGHEACPEYFGGGPPPLLEESSEVRCVGVAEQERNFLHRFARIEKEPGCLLQNGRMDEFARTGAAHPLARRVKHVRCRRETLGKDLDGVRLGPLVLGKSNSSDYRPQEVLEALKKLGGNTLWSESQRIGLSPQRHTVDFQEKA